MRQIILLLVLGLAAANAQAASRCTETNDYQGKTITCTNKSLAITVNATTSDVRTVLYEVPLGTPPAGGWPVALMYQGSGFPVLFSRSSWMPFGAINEIDTIRHLLDNGFAVVAPPANSSKGAWDTNNTTGPYEQTADYGYLNTVFAKIADGTFGPLNPARMYAAGISSGGYNTSRMAVSFAGKFRALAIESASYATCAGPYCTVPATLPADHPPTLFLHGQADTTVPEYTMEPYYSQLATRGIARKVLDQTAGHQWINAAPLEVLNWFVGHP